MNPRNILSNNRSSAFLVIPIAALSLSMSHAYSATVHLSFQGIVNTTYTSQITNGSQLSLDIFYTVGDDGRVSPPDFSSGLIYRVRDNVTSATATVGAIELNGPVANTNWGGSSSLQVDDGTQVNLSDLFQGAVSFGSVNGIAHPLIAFYLYDNTGTSFGPNPALPATWDETSLAQFDTLNFSIYDYNGSQDPNEIARGTLVIPEPSVFLLGFAGLLLAGRRRRN